MDKVLDSDDPTFIAIEVQKLFEKLFSREKNDSVSNLQEVEKAKSLCGHERPLISHTSCNAILQLVKAKRMDLPAAYSWLSSCIFSAKNMCGLIQLTIDLFTLDTSTSGRGKKLKFSMHSQKHPFIEIMQCSSKLCYLILASIRKICPDSEELLTNTIHYDNSLHFLNPVLAFMLSRESKLPLACRTGVWDILIQMAETNLISDSLAQFILSDVESGVEYLYVAEKLLEKPQDRDLWPLVLSVAPSIAAVVQFLVKNGVCPDRALDLLLIAVFRAPTVASLVVMILADTALHSSPRHLLMILNTCHKIMKAVSVSTISEHMVVGSFLRWLIQPTFLQPELSDLMSALIDLTYSKRDLSCPPLNFLDINYFITISAPLQSVQKNAFLLRLYSSVCSNKDVLTTWLKSKNTDFRDFSLFLSGLLLSAQTEEDKRSVIEKLATNEAEQHLTTFIFQLAREKDPKTQFKLLESLHLCNTKSNQGNKLIILQILKGMSSSNDPTLREMALYHQLLFWKVEHRYFPFLHTSLLINDEPSYEMDMVKAKVVNEICKSSPEIYGKNVARPISNILNNSQFSQPCVFALNSIFLLCKAGEIDIESTWRALKPKFMNEKRPEIIRGLCEILSLVPSLISYLDDSKRAFFDEVVETLWNFVTQNSDQKIVSAALIAFSQFCLEHLSLETFPEIYKENAEKAIRTALASSVAEFVFVPGKCWLKALESLPVSCHNETVGLFTKWLSDEVATFHSGIYSKVVDEPMAYSFLQERSLCRSFVEHVRKYSTVTPLPQSLQHSICLCLRILSGPLPKPLPPLKWTFLQNYMIGEWTDLKIYGTKLAIKQAMHKSSSAGNILEAKLSSLAFNEETEQEILNIFESFGGVYHSIHSSTLQRFLNQSLDFASAKINQPNDSSLYATLMISLKKFLSENPLDSRDPFISKMLQDQWKHFNSKPAHSTSLIECISVLSDEHFNEVFPPPTDDDVNFEVVQSYIKLVCSVASIRKTSESIDRMINCVKISSTCGKPMEDKEIHLHQSYLQNQLLPIFADSLPHTTVIFFVKGLMALIEKCEARDFNFLCALLIRVIIVSVGLNHRYVDEISPMSPFVFRACGSSNCDVNEFSLLCLHALPLAVTKFVTLEELDDYRHFFTKPPRAKDHSTNVSFSELFNLSLIALNSFYQLIQP